MEVEIKYGGLTMRISIDENKIKGEIAFTSAADLMYTIKNSIDFLGSK